MRVLLANDASSHSQAAAKYLLAMPFRKPVDLDIASGVGSTSRYVLRHAQCSVLIIRDKEDRLKAKQESLAGQKSVAE